MRAIPSPARRPPPTIIRSGPMGSAVRLTSFIGAQLGKEPRYGVIGLGAGLDRRPCRLRRDVALLRDRSHGRRHRQVAAVHLPHQLPWQVRHRLGDARLTIAKEQDESFDLLIVDAFSSDAIPMHLLTAEAIALYATKLKPEGAGVLHISNRYLDLEAVLATTIPKIAGPACARDRGRHGRRLHRHRLDRRGLRQEHAGHRPVSRSFRARATFTKAASGPGPTIPPIFWGPSCPSSARRRLLSHTSPGCTARAGPL